MEINQLPAYDRSDNPTGCCPRFKPEGWDLQELHFKDKLFVRVETKSLFHIPVNMGQIFSKTFKAIEEANAMDGDQFVILTNAPSPWKSEHYFAVAKAVAGQELVKLNGSFLTKVFEGPYSRAPQWEEQTKASVRERGKTARKIYFFYTTCPSCAKFYGKNYVVVFAEVS
ncbi:hydrolase [Fodinibius sediminis]|uniref:Uncharacterized protein n=1 Tax=Fodinibius sediminis TaxID=1214077 RepID=A0A521BF27_9BACT|nr:hydrolase [Fodinibius sediminis]SMO45320.1 hypothetical protein SAMN06265218_10328 [Fodinibius sediminis]